MAGRRSMGPEPCRPRHSVECGTAVLIASLFGIWIVVPWLTGARLMPPAPHPDFYSAVIQPVGKPAAGPAAVPVIPGLHPEVLLRSLEPHGFDLSQPTERDGVFWTECRLGRNGAWYMVSLRGPTAHTVDQIVVRIEEPREPTVESGKVAFDFLAFMATVPFEGADPLAHRRWVEYQIHGGSTVMAGVQFTVVSIPAPRVRTLTLSLPAS